MYYCSIVVDVLQVSPSVLGFFPGETEKCFTLFADEDSTLEETFEQFRAHLVVDSGFPNVRVVLGAARIAVSILDIDCEYHIT